MYTRVCVYIYIYIYIYTYTHHYNGHNHSHNDNDNDTSSNKCGFPAGAADVRGAPRRPLRALRRAGEANDSTHEV